MASSKKATTQRDILNYTKTEKEKLCKALSIIQMYEGGTINGMMVFNKKHCRYANTRFYICDKCDYEIKICSCRKYKKSTSLTCYRCGRKGHYASNCYASSHIKGYCL